MTIIVGLVYKDGVIIASDSQSTMNRGAPVKRLNQTKIYELKNTSLQVVIGGAGTVPIISKVIEYIQQKVKNKPDSKISEMLSYAENAMISVTRWYNFDRLKELNPVSPPNNITVENNEKPLNKSIQLQQQVQLQPIDVILLVGGIDEDKNPFLNIVLNEGIAERQEKYGAIGSGAAYAEYIVSQLFIEKMTDRQAIKIAAHTIEQVKKIDPHVGGDVQIVNISLKRKIDTFKKTQIDKICGDVGQIQNAVAYIWQCYLNDDFEELTKPLFNKPKVNTKQKLIDVKQKQSNILS